MMVYREKVLAVLTRRFPGAPAGQIAAAANAILGLDEEWEDVSDRQEEFGYNFSPNCSDICYLAQQVERGDQFRVFRRRNTGIRR